MLTVDYRDLGYGETVLENVQASDIITIRGIGGEGAFLLTSSKTGNPSSRAIKYCDYYFASRVSSFVELFFEDGDAPHIEHFVIEAFKDAEKQESCMISGEIDNTRACRYDCVDPRCVVGRLLEIENGLSDYQKRVLVSRYLQEAMNLTVDEQNWLTLNDQSNFVFDIYDGLSINQIIGLCDQENCGLVGGYHEIIKQNIQGLTTSSEDVNLVLEFYSELKCNSPILFNCVRSMQSDENTSSSIVYFKEVTNCSLNNNYSSLVDEIYNTCGCDLGGTNNLEPFDFDSEILEDEPKWGQLGNCNDIVNEFQNIDLSGTLEDQKASIVDHFDCNVKYTRLESGPNINCLSYDDVLPNGSTNPDFCTTKKYLYTEDRGWLDMLHVFTIFQWAQNIFETGSDGSIAGILESAVAAEFEGYGAEAWQWANDNFSGFSYEHLCFNHIGAMMFVSFYSDLNDGNITWVEAVNPQLCNSLDAKEPNEAPNFDYILYPIDDKYPKVFNFSSCLTGEDLDNVGEANFCSMTLEQQIKLVGST